MLQVLAADLNRGYHNLSSWIVSEVNGQPFKDFNAFVKILTTSSAPFTVFKNQQGFQIVIDRQKAQESHAGILQTYNIDADRSSDLK